MTSLRLFRLCRQPSAVRGAPRLGAVRLGKHHPLQLTMQTRWSPQALRRAPVGEAQVERRSGGAALNPLQMRGHFRASLRSPRNRFQALIRTAALSEIMLAKCRSRVAAAALPDAAPSLSGAVCELILCKMSAAEGGRNVAGPAPAAGRKRWVGRRDDADGTTVRDQSSLDRDLI